MARVSKGVFVNLNRLIWKEVFAVVGGGGFGGGRPSVSPYVWTIFFIADGSTLLLTDAGTISGSPVIYTTPGSHGNLGNDLEVGNGIDIPEALGLWSSALQPIPVAESLRSIVGDDLPGFFGAVAVIMVAGGHVSDHGAEAGHMALNAAVQSAVIAILSTIGPSHPMITKDDISRVTTGLAQTVGNAVRENQSLLENLWSLSGLDRSAGYHTWVWNQDLFENATGDQPIKEQMWTDALGLWEIDGDVSVTNQCPAAVAAALLDGLFDTSGRPSPARQRSRKQRHQGLNAMRKFRDGGGLGEMPGLVTWWDVAARHTPQIAMLAMRNRHLQESFGALLAGIGPALRHPTRPLDGVFVKRLEDVFLYLAKEGSTRLKGEMRQPLQIVRQLQNKTLREAMELVSALRDRPRV